MSGCGSHEPALRAAAKFTNIHHVIEFGGGDYSTRTFLNSEIYPDLISLITLEHNSDWAAKCATEDSRHLVVAMPESGFAPLLSVMHADFIFLDNGPEMKDRLALVEPALHAAPIVAIHDIDRPHQLEKFEFRYSKHFNGDVQVMFLSNSVNFDGLICDS